jgi:hypothetical protein
MARNGIEYRDITITLPDGQVIAPKSLEIQYDAPDPAQQESEEILRTHYRRDLRWYDPPPRKRRLPRKLKKREKAAGIYRVTLHVRPVVNTVSWVEVTTSFKRESEPA